MLHVRNHEGGNLTPSGNDGSATPHEGGTPDTLVVWSAARMIERLEGDEALARQLVLLFFGEQVKLLTNLHASVRGGNADHVRRAAHAAKGCIANFIEDGPQATAYRIEQLAAAGQLTDVPGLAAQLECEVTSLVEQMRKFVQETPCAS